MKITFHGAALTTTGSMHLLEHAGRRILLDCGLFQGHRKEAFERNRNLPFDAGSIDAVVLSHAHIDHSGNLPTLVKRGFRGPIYTTPATADLCDIMLRDSAYLQCRDVEYVNKRRLRQGKKPFEPLYCPEDVDAVIPLFRRTPYEQDFDLADGLSARFHDAGHLLGAALTTFDLRRNGTTKRLLFTGDMGRKDRAILRDPTVVEDVDWLITESTYGDRLHPSREDVQGRLKAFVEDIAQQRSRLVIPAFSVGRTQNIVYLLRELYERGRVPAVPVYVDSPLSTKATQVYADHPECYDRDALRVLMDGGEPFQFRGLHYTESVEESKRLNEMSGPLIIISASGMCEGGRILHHLRHSVEDPRNIILIVGYQAEHTLGRRIVERVSPVKIFGELYELRARVHTINALSAHADRDELLEYFRQMGVEKRPPERTFVVHGEEPPARALAAALEDLGLRQVSIPHSGESADL